MLMPRSRLLCAMALLLGLAAPAMAQKQGGTLRVTHRDNPPSASIIEEATISTDMPFMAVFNNLVVFDPDTIDRGEERPVFDMPGDGLRYVRDSIGVDTVLVNGQVAWSKGVYSGSASGAICGIG